jgi:hypothetical protein
MSPAVPAVGYMQSMPGDTAATLHQYQNMVREWAVIGDYDLHERVFIDRSCYSCREFDRMLTEIEIRAIQRPSVIILPHAYALAPSNGERARKEDLLLNYDIRLVYMTLLDRVPSRH